MPLPYKYINEVLRYHAKASDYVARGCLSPRVMSLIDSFGIHKDIVIDCGHCERCQDAAREEWATRMLLHSYSTEGCIPNPWKYCYFITLTYGTYDLSQSPDHPFYKDWMVTFPSLDTDNQHKSYAWTPSVLYRPHIQKYIKRLRKELADVTPVSYVYCGEYGHEHGRPHWHLIVWTYQPVTHATFKDAWGYVMPDGSKFEIGRVDYEDIMHNGTMSETVKFDGATHDAKYCFTYLAKYCRKFISDSISPSAYKRLARAWSQLDFDDYDYDMAQMLDRPFVCVNRMLKYQNNTIYDVSFKKFCQIYAPCFASSTSYGIGRKYWLDNRTRFEKGSYSLPNFRSKPLHFPRYYSHLLALSRCPIRFEKLVVSGRSLCKANYQAAMDYFFKLAEDPYSIPSAYTRPFNGFDRHAIAIHDNHIDYDYVVLKQPTGKFKGILNPETDSFEFYSWNKSARMYELSFEYSRLDFCGVVLDILLREKDAVLSSLPKFEQMALFYNTEFNKPDCQSAIDTYRALRSDRQKKYEKNHKYIPE